MTRLQRSDAVANMAIVPGRTMCVDQPYSGSKVVVMADIVGIFHQEEE